MDFSDFNFMRTYKPDWTTVNGIEKDVKKNVSRLLFRKVSVNEAGTKFQFRVVVKLWPWAWFWLGKKHEEVRLDLQSRCEDYSALGTIGVVIVE